ncbi:MAG: hypothetical protein ABR947_00035 [Solirubrobacteraceae bacterium]
MSGRADRGGVLVGAWGGVLALVAVTTGVRGVDLPAATYRVDLFAQRGFTLWDSQWYGGHWLFDYSVLYAPIAWLGGVTATEIISAAVASWAFHRLAAARFATAGRVGALVFATGTLVPVAIGQGPYLMGEAIALLALLAARGGRPVLALPLAVVCSLVAPLAGAFLALAAAAWLVGDWPQRRFSAAALAAAALVPIGVVEELFPGQGNFPFSTHNFLGMMIGAVAVGLVAAIVRDRALAAGAALYVVAILFAYEVPSALGNNITRLGISVGVALAVCLAWTARRSRLLLLVAVVPIALAQWVPASNALAGKEGDIGVSRAYYQPLLRFLARSDHPLGRVEVVPTALHWEAVYVALRFPLARGWERQLDTANNPIFYDPGRLTSRSYRAWLLQNGVRFVALSNARLDYSAYGEAYLVRRGVPGLRLVWRDADWRVYEVRGSQGILQGPGRLLSADGDGVELRAIRAGAILLRVHYSAAWHVAKGDATVSRSPGGWLSVNARGPGPVTLRISFPT